MEGLMALSEQLEDSRDKVDVWNELAYKHRGNRDNEAARVLATDAIELAVRLQYLEGEAAAYNILGNLAKSEADYPQAERLFEKALALRLKDGNKEGASSCHNNLGLLYRDWGANYEKASASFADGLGLLDDPLSKMAGTLLNNLGDVLSRMGRHDEAVVRLRESVVIRKGLKDEAGLALSRLNLAGALQKVRDYGGAEALLEESLAFFEENEKPAEQGKCHLLMGDNALRQQQYQEALARYDMALTFKNNLDPIEVAFIYHNRGIAFFQLGENKKALDNYQPAREEFEKHQNSRELAALYCDIGNVYYDQSSFEPALSHYRQSLAILEADSVRDPELERSLMSNLGDTYRKLERYAEAFDYQQKYNQSRDSIAERAQDALVLEKQMAEEEASSGRKKMILYGVAGFIILWLLLALAVLYAYNQQKKRKIVDQEVDNLLQRQELALFNARQEAQDQERNRIARDLHDGLGSMLTIIKMRFDDLHSQIDEMQKEARSQYQNVNELLEKAFQSVRAVARNLQSLDQLGLKEALGSLAVDIQGNKQLSVELATFGLEERMDRKLEYELFKIIQTLVSNVLKHSGATKLAIQVNRFDGLVNVMVEDNGVGFDPGQAQKKGGIGLNSVAIRVDSLGGTLRIDSASGKGATVTADIPWNKEPE